MQMFLNNYEQGWKQVRDSLKREAYWKQYARLSRPKSRKVSGLIAKLLGFVFLAAFIGRTIFAFAGCAVPPAKPAAAPVEIRTAVTLTGFVQIGQSGLTCDDEHRALRDVLASTFYANGPSLPDRIKIRELSGSSLCGIAQGMANLFGTPELGARNVARAEVMLYWSGLTSQEIARAREVFSWMQAEP